MNLFHNLSAIKNNQIASMALITMAIMSLPTEMDIHRILVYTDRVELTLVNKESTVSLFQDWTYTLNGGLEMKGKQYFTLDYHKE